MLSTFLLPTLPSRILMNHARAFVDPVSYLLAVRVGRDCLFPFLRAEISTVAVNFIFRAVLQLTRLRYIAHVPSCDFYMVDQPRVTVYTDMRFVAEVPVLSLLARMRFRITLFLFVLR